MAFVWTGIKIMEIAIIIKLCKIMIMSVLVLVVICVNINMMITSSDAPGIIIARGPNLSNILPAIGENNPLSTPPGSMINPAAKADKARAPCKYVGSSSNVENKVIIAIIMIMIAMLNIGYLKTRKSSIG